MPKYSVTVDWSLKYITRRMEIEADNEEQARDIADCEMDILLREVGDYRAMSDDIRVKELSE